LSDAVLPIRSKTEREGAGEQEINRHTHKRSPLTNDRGETNKAYHEEQTPSAEPISSLKLQLKRSCQPNETNNVEDYGRPDSDDERKCPEKTGRRQLVRCSPTVRKINVKVHGHGLPNGSRLSAAR
jgi:hypothetical protein